MVSLRQHADYFRKVISTILLSAAFWLAFFSISHAEEITSFESNIVINSDGSFVVTETIEYDFGSANKHGIFRNIKNQHAQPASVWYKKRFIDIALLSVTKDGLKEPYSLESFGGLSVKIGNPSSTITGKHKYVISYKVDGALVIYPDVTELYWNVTGDEWQVPISNVSARVSFSQGGTFDESQYCYVGSHGSNSVCEKMELKGSVALFNTRYISPGDGFTIAQAIKLPTVPVAFEKYNMFVLVIIGISVWYILLGLWIYRWRIKYRKSKTVVPQYEPYQDFRPMFTGVLIDNRLDNRDITAGIIYLAQQGFISIKQIDNDLPWLLKKVFDTSDFELTLLSVSDPELDSHKQLLRILFRHPNEIGKKIKLSELKKDYSQMRSNHRIIQELKKAVSIDMENIGFTNKLEILRLTPIKLLYYVAAVALLIFTATFFFKERSVWVVVLVCFGISPIFAYASERRTQKGYEALYYLKGFKDFLSVTEKERYKFHNAPSLNSQNYMEYLPYAIAFGVEKEWAEIFKDIQIDFPDWYKSSGNSDFSSTAFNSSLSSFSKSFLNSTGSGGRSGSSGGGSSGGGSGGGGGGSW